MKFNFTYLITTWHKPLQHLHPFTYLLSSHLKNENPFSCNIRMRHEDNKNSRESQHPGGDHVAIHRDNNNFLVFKRVQYPFSKAVAIRCLTPSCSDVDIACWGLFRTLSLILLLFFCLVLFFQPTIVLPLFLVFPFCCSILQ